MGTRVAITLRRTRKVYGLSQQDIATLLAVDRTTISKLERGKRWLSGEQVALVSLIYGHPLPVIYEKSSTEFCALLLVRAQQLRSKRKHSRRTQALDDLNARLTALSSLYAP